uniref:DUF1993 domain-containing protein n=1 Tax=Archangium gephyra TaxID=48 RepID=A0A3S7UYD2_9BACT|nr:hypothetical protein [Archangium gephyra]
MSLSMYQASIPVFIRMLGNLSGILEKAAAYAETKKIEPSVLINSRLAPDMRPLSFQIQIASDLAKGCAARLAGIDPPSMTDTESTFPELQERIKKTIAFLQTVSAAQVDGSEEREVVLKMRGTEMQFKGQPYLLGFVLPNFYFHVTTAYNILRHNGLDIGKADFLGVR